jgi:hypothetical protein
MKTKNFMKFLSILLVITILLITVTSAVSAVTPTISSNNSVTSSVLSQSPSDNLQVNNIPNNALGAPNSVNTYVGVNVTANGIGTSDDPYNNLELALNASHENDTILIMDGTYSGVYNINKNINITGLTIKADSNAYPIFDGNQSRIFTISANDVTLSGLTFINGHSTLDAGAVYANGVVNLTISNCTFFNNTAGRDGAAMELDRITNLLVTDCTFFNNSATRFAGGFYASGNNITLSNVKFKNNTAGTDAAAFFTDNSNNISINNCLFEDNIAGLNNTKTYSEGGALYMESCNNISFNNSIFRNNSAGDVGGAFILYGSNNILLSNCLFDKNSVGLHSLRKYSDGGALYLGKLNNFTMINTIFTNNSVVNATPALLNMTTGFSFNGGAIYTKGLNNSLINNCEFYYNIAPQIGGGLFLDAVNSVVNNSVFKYNTGGIGGAIRFGGSNATINCTLENSLIANNTAIQHAGGICERAINSTIKNCDIINNTAPYSAGIHVHSTSNLFENINFINNTATDFGAGISIVGEVPNVYNLTNTIKDCNFVGNKITNATGYGAGIEIKGSYAVVDNCTLTNNTAADGAGIHIIGENTTIKNCDIFNNSAKNVGGGIWINGSNATIFNTSVYDNTAADGAGIDITGNDINISNVKVYGNLANNGAGLYINVNNLTFTDSVVYNNNATVNGGGAYINGNNSYLKNVTFTYNNAIPDYDKLDDGLGGAFMVTGENTTVLDSLFDYNTARNGSAIYNNGNGVQINNTSFHDNQAWIYWIPTFHNETAIYSTLYGGNNILNAIYNNGSFSSISINGSNPVDGAENSLNGTIPYQDGRECNQTIVTEVWDDNGNLIYNVTKITDLYGHIEFPVSLDTKLWYVVRMTHLEDTYYKAISNTTVLNNMAGLNITNVVMYEGDTTAQLINIVLNNDHLNGISNASTVNIYVKVNGTYIYLGSQNTNDVGMVKFEELNIFHTLPVGDYELIANYTNDDGKYNICNTTGKLTVLPLYYHITKTVIGSNNVKVGDSISFIIHFSNDVNHTLSSVRVSDIIPSGLSLTSYSAKDWTYEGSGVWAYNGLFPALGTSDIIVNFIAIKAGNYTNFAIVTPNNINGTNSSNVTVQISNKSTIHPTGNSTVNTHGNSITPNVVETNKDSSTLNYGVKMQHTGLPILVLILAILAILAGGLKRKN